MIWNRRRRSENQIFLRVFLSPKVSRHDYLQTEQGEAYNNNGITLSSVYKTDADTDLIQGTKSVIYRLGLVTRDTKDSTPTVFRSTVTLFPNPRNISPPTCSSAKASNIRDGD